MGVWKWEEVGLPSLPYFPTSILPTYIFIT
jgi:hypothetical protein